MKKIIALLMVLVMVCALAACGQKAPAPAEQAEPTFEFDNDSTPFDVSTLSEDEVKKVKVRGTGLHPEDRHPRGSGVL